MAKKDWMSRYMNPSGKGFASWLRSQTGQYNPLIGVLKDQLVGMRPEKDFNVQAYEKLLGAQPSRESIAGSYQSARDSMAKYMQDLDTTKGAQGVSDIIGSVGAGLGVSPGVSGDLAQAAGTLSGVGAQGGDVMSKAIMSGMTAQLSGQQTQALSDAAQRNMDLMLGLGQAKSTAKSGQREIARMLAELKGKKSAATLNPFDIANSVMSFKQNQKQLMEYLKGSSGGGGRTQQTQTPPPNDNNPPTYTGMPYDVVASGLNSLLGVNRQPGPRGMNR